MKKIALSLVLLTACAAPAPREEVQPAAAAQAFDPVGVYDFTTTVEGQTVTGVLTIQRGTAGLGGTMSTDVTGSFPLSKVTVAGRRVDMTAASPNGNMALQMTVAEDNRLTGSWSLEGGMMTGTVTGTRRTN